MWRATRTTPRRSCTDVGCRRRASENYAPTARHQFVSSSLRRFQAVNHKLDPATARCLVENPPRRRVQWGYARLACLCPFGVVFSRCGLLASARSSERAHDRLGGAKRNANRRTARGVAMRSFAGQHRASSVQPAGFGVAVVVLDARAYCDFRLPCRWSALVVVHNRTSRSCCLPAINIEVIYTCVLEDILRRTALGVSSSDLDADHLLLALDRITG